MPLEANRRRRSYAVSDSRSSDECSKMSNEQTSPCKFNTAAKRNEMFPAAVDQNDPMRAEEMEGQLRFSKAGLSPYVNSQLDQA